MFTVWKIIYSTCTQLTIKKKMIENLLLAHLTWSVMWAIVITLRLLSVNFLHFFSKTTFAIGTKLGKKCSLGGIYQILVFGADRKFKMAAMTNNVFWLADISKIYSQKQLSGFDYDILEICIRLSCNSFAVLVTMKKKPRWLPWKFLTCKKALS